MINFPEAESAISSVISSYDAIEHGRIPVWSAKQSIGGFISQQGIDDEDNVGPQRIISSIPFLGDSMFTFDQYCIDKLFPAF